MAEPAAHGVADRAGLLEDFLEHVVRVIALFDVGIGELDFAQLIIAALARDKVDCMYIQTAPPVPAFVREIGALLLKHRIPAISELRDLARSGAVLSYGPNLFESTRRQVYFVDRILKGTKPSDLPVEEATKLELVINLKTAKALSLEVPPTLLALADEVIE